MKRRYAQPDYLAAFMMLGVVFAVGFVAGAVVTALLREAF